MTLRIPPVKLAVPVLGLGGAAVVGSALFARGKDDGGPPDPEPTAADLREMEAADRRYEQHVARMEQLGPEKAADVEIPRFENWLEDRVGRDGYDNDGHTPIIRLRENASTYALYDEFDDARIVFGREPWAWDHYDPMTVGHEYMHLVMDHELTEHDPSYKRHSIAEREYTQLEGPFKKDLPPGECLLRGRYPNKDLDAIHEGVGDAVGAIYAGSWYMKGIRDPSLGKGVITSYNQMDATHKEEHDASGIVSEAAARIQERLGDQATLDILYGAIMNENFDGDTTMNDFARMAAATALDEYGEKAYEVVVDELEDNDVCIEE
jgi:hypothetical protein